MREIKQIINANPGWVATYRENDGKEVSTSPVAMWALVTEKDGVEQLEYTAGLIADNDVINFADLDANFERYLYQPE